MAIWWNEAEFKARVEARARELNKSVTQVLQEAGLDDHTLQAKVTSRRIDTIEKLAVALRWTPAEVMGHTPDPAQMLLAGELAYEVVRRRERELRLPRMLPLFIAALVSMHRYIAREPGASLSPRERELLIAQALDANHRPSRSRALDQRSRETIRSPRPSSNPKPAS